MTLSNWPMRRRSCRRYYREVRQWRVGAANNFDEEVVKVFHSNKVNGKVLSLLTEEDFKELRLTALGDRQGIKESEMLYITSR